MIISCEKCSTTYVLDDALIPPQGAPVQCTQCQHVFTAKRPAPEAPPPAPPAARPGTSTMMFGSPAAGVTAAAQKNTTMMFGAPGAGAAPAAPAAAPSARATMVFGAPAIPPAAPKAPPSFGTPASNAAGGGMPAPAAAGKNQTMMFGAAPAPAPAATAPPPPAAAKNQTMMFGSPAVPAASPAPAPAAPAKNQTMMFGGPAVPPVNPAPTPAAPAKNQTMMFGSPAVPAASPAPAPAPAAPAKNQTMMFGTAASQAAATAAPAAPPAAGKATMVFGSMAPVAAPPAKPGPAATFGTAAGNAAAAAAQASAPVPAAAAKTQLVAETVDEPAEETLLEQPGRSNRTVLFGTAQPAPGPAPAAAPASAAPAKNQTMMFGRAPVIPKVTAGTIELAGIAADENQPNESTVRVDQQALMGDEEGAQAAPPAEAPRSEVEARHDRTQRYAMSETGPTPPGGQSAVEARHNRTQLFAMSSVQEETETVAPALSPFASEPMSAGTPMVGDTTLPPTSPNRLDREVSDFATTLPADGPGVKFSPRAKPDPAGVSVLQEAGEPAGVEAEPAGPAPVATTLPGLAPLDAQRMPALPLELPPEPQGSPRDLLAAQQRQAAAAESETVQLPRGSSGGAGKVIVIILAIIALALAGVLAWRLFGRQLLEKQGSAEALKTAEDALAGLRRDDGEAQDQAIARLKPLLASHPELHEARAAMVLVAALQLDDAKALAEPDEARARKLRGEAEGESEAAQTAKAQLANVELELAKHRATIDSRKVELLEHVGRLRALPAPEQGGAAEIAVLRAEAIARGVLGEHEALALAERVRQLTPQSPDNWAELAGPEFALNGGSSREEALKDLEAVRGRATNSTFFRPYVLTARLHLQAGDDTLAAQDLTTVVSLNGKHAVAQRLLASITSRN